ncbi:MAG: DUF488 family protein [Brevundimonas sp.]|uniref:DUF488 domain-containing protein n=1 Tax=Brevundimonas sp. TaxID=1871086 RepID=UPI003918EDFA
MGKAPVEIRVGGIDDRAPHRNAGVHGDAGDPPVVAHLMCMKLFTIGYEGATQAEVIARLKTAGVETLVDVRAVAASRRAGFSKTILGESLKAEGIDYLHLRGLGTPKAGRDAARKGRVAEMRAIFADHLAKPQAQMEYERLKALAGEKRVALLCFEADHAGCHRAVLAERLAAEDGVMVVNL